LIGEKGSESKPSLSQIDRFREAARELETDDSEENFNRVLKKVVQSPPPKDDQPKGKKPA